ncbi:uncharacterized protein MONOS_14756 [Monocercomonoides exilis]|uniref:uncharacterized protein n=1 Tax=Monocercomonoides exilis TaxID=2049356 RepID=UPI00355A8EA4|nr:hypothetical protein MONOS_14756 [Monocercomonoides exilis]|eukprot:MONOS_14756.1-p1 / transcript=MONOS_14756.1 / gene=MONOS_14756 / organism=Monocercomonoides_exilis_PA203 / gene_product=unspecified product / transcript_product=unspecified product / location=Mono_scaffold01065:5974-6845(+) / protein_length=72 / sequence_SO=supercontig / SO=protein_coding / is_pseudo=false
MGFDKAVSVQGAGICCGASGQRRGEDISCGVVSSDIYDWELDAGKAKEAFIGGSGVRYDGDRAEQERVGCD